MPATAVVANIYALADQIEGDYVRPVWIAETLGLSADTVYRSMAQYRECVRSGDMEQARQFIPNLQLGLQSYRIPKAAFLLWWACAGLHADAFIEMWGELGQAVLDAVEAAA